ncbi:MAG: 16S rRNA (cytidine(1402)-2'-O)-methyltransferase [Pseudomonadota bacterium]|nr:16S rRNA (cytidine(1402)-2'-O)-methyltransferase [Pseudomonadota bacterium]
MSVHRGPGILHLVPTPIGDPEDITLRALRVLREADLVAAEDTRTTAMLFRAHDLHAPLVSYHDHNEVARAAELVERIRGGARVALVSDAGTPLVNDPGWRVVRACIDAGLQIDVLPGACAAIVALAGAGLPVDRFYYGGFLPRDEGPRREALAELAALRATLVFYESPVRLATTLDTLAHLWPTRPVCVARNLTKEHEQWIRGTAAEARAILGEETRGEVVLLVGGAPEGVTFDPATLDARITQLMSEGLGARDIASQLAAATGLPRREIYQRAVALSRSEPPRR